MRQSPFSIAQIPVTVRGLIIANALGLLLTWSNPGLYAQWALWPLGNTVIPGGFYSAPGFEPWQLLSYGFLHANFSHFFFNMFGLWMFGRIIEATWGSRRFLVYYLVCVVGAGLSQLAVMYLFHSGVGAPTIGASGGVFGILLAFGMLYPNARVMLLIPPIPMKAKWLVIGYGALELFLGVGGYQAGVAHFAHLGGMAFGLVLILYWQRQFKR